MKGWPALEAQAKKNWGSGKWNIVLNPKEVRGSPSHWNYSVVSDGHPLSSTLDSLPPFASRQIPPWSRCLVCRYSIILTARTFLIDILAIPTGKPQCSTQKQSTGGQLVGSSGSVALAQTQGTHMTQHTSVTRACTLVHVGSTITDF